MQPLDKMLPQGYQKLDNGDLKFNDNKLRVHAYETIGKRDAQEDAMTINEVPSFNQLTEREQRIVLLHTYDEINKKLKAQSTAGVLSAKDTGTTSLTCLSYVTKKEDKTIVNIVSANLADSSAYYFIRSKITGKIRHCARINKNLHKPNDPAETFRIKQAGGTVEYNRVDSMLAVARAFGDFVLSDKVVHTPDIDSLAIELNKGEELLLIAACDGLTENRKVQDGKDAKFFSKTGVIQAEPNSEILALKTFIEQECAKLDFDQLPAALKEWAINTNFSKDNITVIVQSIDADSKESISQHAIMLAIFDGHNGTNVSRFVADNFYNILNQQISKFFKPTAQERNATLRVIPLSEPSADSEVNENTDYQAPGDTAGHDVEPLNPPKSKKVTELLPEKQGDATIDNGPPIPPKPRAIAQPAPAIIKPGKSVNFSVVSELPISAVTTKAAEVSGPPVLSDPSSAVAQQEAINAVPSVVVKENIWLTKEIIIQIKKDYEAKFNAKFFRRTSVESKQLLDDLNEGDAPDASQKKINTYLANDKFKNKRLYEVLIEKRIDAQIALAIKNKEPEMFSPHVERSWLNNTTIDDICFLIEKRYSHARGFKFFGYTSKESFLLLERLRKPSLSDQDKEDKKREIENYLVNNKDADTRLYNIITALFNKLHKEYTAALYHHSSHVLAT